MAWHCGEGHVEVVEVNHLPQDRWFPLRPPSRSTAWCGYCLLHLQRGFVVKVKEEGEIRVEGHKREWRRMMRVVEEKGEERVGGRLEYYYYWSAWQVLVWIDHWSICYEDAARRKAHVLYPYLTHLSITVTVTVTRAMEAYVLSEDAVDFNTWWSLRYAHQIGYSIMHGFETNDQCKK